MRAASSGKALTTLTTELSRKWAETREQWPDQKSAEFEREYLSELVAAVSRAPAVFEDLDQVLERVRRDCE